MCIRDRSYGSHDGIHCQALADLADRNMAGCPGGPQISQYIDFPKWIRVTKEVGHIMVLTLKRTPSLNQDVYKRQPLTSQVPPSLNHLDSLYTRLKLRFSWFIPPISDCSILFALAGLCPARSWHKDFTDAL